MNDAAVSDYLTMVAKVLPHLGIDPESYSEQGSNSESGSVVIGDADNGSNWETESSGRLVALLPTRESLALPSSPPPTLPALHPTESL
jgi:hypothetical protein